MRESGRDARFLRAWKTPLSRAAIAWWGGAWLPLMFGPLSECGHCVQSWLWMLPVLPGFAPARLVQSAMAADYTLAVAAWRRASSLVLSMLSKIAMP